jgi:hypothetical protein
MLIDTRYDLLLDRKSKFECIQAAPFKDVWLFMDCGRWNEGTGILIRLFLEPVF